MKDFSVHSQKSSLRGSMKEENKLEMQDMRAASMVSEEEKVRSLPSNQRVTGAVVFNNIHEEIKSNSSFNRSEGGVL